MPANGIGAAANKTEVSTSDGPATGLPHLLIMLRKEA
jgi:hypothetical protein